MRKGHILILGNVAYDPDKIAHFDFGTNQYGQRRCRCEFNDPATKGGSTTRSKEEYGMLLEFAETNALVRERDLKFSE
ncbi:hypothetical protein [Spirosoma aerophilum]